MLNDLGIDRQSVPEIIMRKIIIIIINFDFFLFKPKDKSKLIVGDAFEAEKAKKFVTPLLP